MDVQQSSSYCESRTRWKFRELETFPESIAEPSKRIMGEHMFQTEAHAELYSEFRPAPPVELLKIVVSVCRNTDKLLDVGCGTGQSTEPMTEFFGHVIGTDNSEAQIAQAKRRQNEADLRNLEYRVCSSNELTFEGSSFDAITACQCVHYFDLDKFYAEAHRVLRKDGILALSGYCIPVPSVGDPEMDAAIKERIMKLCRVELGPYFEVDIDYFDRCYETLPAPKSGFELVEKNLKIIKEWPTNLHVYLSYLKSWSPYVHFRKDHPENDIMASLRSDLRAICQGVFQQKGDSDCKVEVDTRYFVHIFRKVD
ncbi:putative methyltransferase DDB_G0268948 [Galendromus occidentalis]|uniref:Methyltransferase DDB_G0268948 n=1 Tax=Galendromus occidentalis TaxID=34638 RepID=A0AAJ7PA27_9ACAR|nr:putative methyltransferase DDB_G0268948 [Galendromus occidentalis]